MKGVTIMPKPIIHSNLPKVVPPKEIEKNLDLDAKIKGQQQKFINNILGSFLILKIYILCF